MFVLRIRAAAVPLALLALAVPLLGITAGQAAGQSVGSVSQSGHGGVPFTTTSSSRATGRTDADKGADKYVPPTGVLFNNPLVKSETRVILGHVIKAINETNGGQQIRIATWNFDDKPSTDALIRAYNRGVAVQVVSSTQVDTPDFYRLQKALKQPSKHRGLVPAKSFAMKCAASCRGSGGIMHTKLYMFSKIHSATDTVMFGSNNLTTAAGNHQWDDMITVSDKTALWKQYLTLFRQLRQDKPVKPTPYVNEFTPNHVFHTYIYPLGKNNGGPILANLKKVKCSGAAPGYGDGNGHTLIRIAIAGWFDAYGDKIAVQVRKLWDEGCDVKVIDTLVGGGVRRELNKTSGRGPIPNREVTEDRNGDGVPEKYTHLKYFTIDGNYRGSGSSRIVFTGSCNWSQRSVTSDEILVGVAKSAWVKKYEQQVDDLYDSPIAMSHARTSATGAATDPGLALEERRETTSPGSTSLPSWFELN